MRLRAADHGLAGQTVSMHAIDLVDLAPIGMTQRQVTQEGLIAPAHISKFGIQAYRASELGLKGVDANHVLFAFRPESEVFDPDSSRSFEFNPLANDHTKEDVGPKNWRQLVSAGRVVGEVRNVARDGDHLGATIVVRDQKAINDIVGGKSQLSCGYDFDADFTPGEYQGRKYDFVQRRIRGNHVAIVDRARGGFGCRVADRDPDATNNRSTNMAENAFTAITINGITFRVAAEDSANAISVRDAYDKMSALHKSGCAALTEAKGHFDAMKAQHKAVVGKLGKKDDDEDESMQDGKKGKDEDLVGLLDIKLAAVRSGIKKANDAAIGAATAAVTAATKRATDAEAKATDAAIDERVAAKQIVIAGAIKLVGDGFKSEGLTVDAIRAAAITHVIAKDAALKPIAEALLAGADIADAKSSTKVADAFIACVAAKGTVKATDRAADPIMQILSGTRPGSAPVRAADASAADAEASMTPQQIRNFRDAHCGLSPRELSATGGRA